MKMMAFALTAGLVLLTATTGSAHAQAVPDDRALQQLVEERLLDKDITGVRVSVERRIATLSGIVPNLWVKERALERARDTRGVLGVVSELAIARPESDTRIANEIGDRIRQYVFFTIFDDLEVAVDDGAVTLTGKVTLPYKADAFVDLAMRVKGVQTVRNDVQTLPVSMFDDQLRYTIARRIYGDPMFWNLAFQPDPPLHIIVERGHVTLTGVVASEVERRLAEVIARSTFGVFDVENKVRLAED